MEIIKNNYCKHNKSKYICVECKGSQICEHNKRRTRCIDCNGSSICHHSKIKTRCKECKGSEICNHNKRKDICKDCKGSQICEHNKRRTICKDCKGSQICLHNISKLICKDCKGSQICNHNKDKKYCKDCKGSSLCKTEHCETYGNKKYKGYCLRCFIYKYPDEPNIRNYKTKEKNVIDRLRETFINLTIIEDKKIKDGCSLRRPDWLVDMGSHVIIVEVDEDRHLKYDCICENKRIMEISQDLGHRPIVLIRFNPDGYTENEIKKSSCWKTNKLGIFEIMKTKQLEWDERIKILKEQIQYWIDNTTEKTIEIIELFY